MASNEKNPNAISETPSHIQGMRKVVAHEAQECSWTKVVHLADPFHGAADAKFTPGAGHHDEKEEQCLEHYSKTPVVLGAVRPTINTPKQITAMPSHRNGVTSSPSRK